MKDFKSNAIGFSIIGIMLGLIWLTINYLRAEHLVDIAKFILFGMALITMLTFFAVPTLKRKIKWLLIIILMTGATSGLGAICGLSTLVKLGAAENILTCTGNWLLYPFIGIMIWSVCSFPVMLYFYVETETNIKNRWNIVAQIFGGFAIIAAILGVAYLVISLF